MRSPTERPQGKKRTRLRAELGGGQQEQGGLEQTKKENCFRKLLSAVPVSEAGLRNTNDK